MYTICTESLLMLYYYLSSHMLQNRIVINLITVYNCPHVRYSERDTLQNLFQFQYIKDMLILMYPQIWRFIFTSYIILLTSYLSSLSLGLTT